MIYIREDNTPIEILASRYYLKNATKYNENNKFSKSIISSTQAIKLDNNNSEAYYARGLAYFNKYQLDRALEDYTQAISIDSKVPSYYLMRAEAFDAKKQIDLVIKDLEKAIDLDSNGTYKYLFEEFGIRNYSRQVGLYFINKFKE